MSDYSRDMSMDDRIGELQAASKRGRDIRKSGPLNALRRSVEVHGSIDQIRAVGELVCRAESKFGALKVDQKGMTK
ncbi:hypothetical protein GCM10027404_00970 [Arthrobacter tumbae]|uniref:hypothetical protein n=1 Tax=Arthrobacter tumbae TaxID=163874 RepID=UPI001958D3FF|nr:hypothetical protein [Arthrobacter tumbae]MBM7780459.1 hypothetical protein [Arthrobacter tumbae]